MPKRNRYSKNRNISYSGSYQIEINVKSIKTAGQTTADSALNGIARGFVVLPSSMKVSFIGNWSAKCRFCYTLVRTNKLFIHTKLIQRRINEI